MSRSLTLPHPTDDVNVLYRESLKLYQDLRVAVAEVRGIGIQLQKLNNEDTCPIKSTSAARTSRTVTLSQHWRRTEAMPTTDPRKEQAKTTTIVGQLPKETLDDTGRKEGKRGETNNNQEKGKKRAPRTKTAKPQRENKMLKRKGKGKALDDQNINTLTQTLRRNNEKAKLELRELPEKKRKRKTPAGTIRAAVVSLSICISCSIQEGRRHCALTPSHFGGRQPMPFGSGWTHR